MLKAGGLFMRVHQETSPEVLLLFCHFFTQKGTKRGKFFSGLFAHALAVLKSVWIKRKEGTKSRIRNLHNSDSLTLIPLISCNRDMGVRNEGADGSKNGF